MLDAILKGIDSLASQLASLQSAVANLLVEFAKLDEKLKAALYQQTADEVNMECRAVLKEANRVRGSRHLYPSDAAFVADMRRDLEELRRRLIAARGKLLELHPSPAATFTGIACAYQELALELEIRGHRRQFKSILDDVYLPWLRRAVDDGAAGSSAAVMKAALGKMEKETTSLMRDHLGDKRLELQQPYEIRSSGIKAFFPEERECRNDESEDGRRNRIYCWTTRRRAFSGGVTTMSERFEFFEERRPLRVDLGDSGPAIQLLQARVLSPAFVEASRDEVTYSEVDEPSTAATRRQELGTRAWLGLPRTLLARIAEINDARLTAYVAAAAVAAAHSSMRDFRGTASRV